jgi:hypothetical protein
MQSSLFSLPEEVKRSLRWCRRATGSKRLLVVGLPSPVPPAVLLWLSQSCTVKSLQVLPSQDVALLLGVPDLLMSEFLALPSPIGGSRHESNQLPW